jgi:hypothetical protein
VPPAGLYALPLTHDQGEGNLSILGGGALFLTQLSEALADLGSSPFFFLLILRFDPIRELQRAGGQPEPRHGENSKVRTLAC